MGAYEISIARSIIQGICRHQAKGFTYKIPVNLIFKTICRIDAMAWLSWMRILTVREFAHLPKMVQLLGQREALKSQQWNCRAQCLKHLKSHAACGQHLWSVSRICPYFTDEDRGWGNLTILPAPEELNWQHTCINQKVKDTVSVCGFITYSDSGLITCSYPRSHKCLQIHAFM